MILWKISWREATAHRGRTLLTAASIVVGVAAVVAVRLSVAAVRQSFGAMQSALAGQAALQIDAPGGGLFPQSLADESARVPGVAQAAPILEKSSVLYSEGRRVNLLLWGVDPARDAAVRDYTLAEGVGLAAGKGLLLDAAFARGAGLRLHDPVRLLTSRGRLSVEVAGLLQPQTGTAAGRGSVGFLPLATVQRQFKAEGLVNQIQIVLAEKANLADVQIALAARVPAGLSVHRPGFQTQMGDETMRFFQKALQLASYFVLLAAAFIVVNAYFMNVTQRRRQLAVLRAIGATRNQVRVLIVREAALLAAVSTATGILAGWGAAVFLAGSLERLFGTDLPPLGLTVPTVALAAAFGLGVSLIGAFPPAQRAASVTPLEAMHEFSHFGRARFPRRLIAVGLVAFPLTAALLAARLLGWTNRYDAALAAVAALVAVVPLFGLALRPASRFLAWLLRPAVGPEMQLARRQLLSRQVRTVLTAGVLFVVCSTGLGLASMVFDRIEDIRGWSRRAVSGDFVLRTTTPDLARWELAEMPEQAETQARAVPGVATLYAVRFVRGEAAGQSVMIIAREYETEDTLGVDPAAIAPGEMLRRFQAGEATIGSVLATRAGLAPGDTLEVQTQHGPQRFRIAALENDYMAGGLTVHLERDVARRRLDMHGADVIIVRAQPGRRAAVQAALQKIADEHGLILQSYAEVSAMIDDMQSGVVAGLWAVILLGLLVAALGATNTLSMNVWEQMHELAMLRVIAMTRRQTSHTVYSQAAMLGAIGAAPGVLAGWGLAWVINRSMMQEVGHPVPFGFRPLVLAAGFAAAMLAVLLAAWFPARRAVEIDPLDALRYE